ncbi:GSCFA domain-containing protein [Pigmentiphaga aceris]|uniref:GSCFA domain-containing protein n=2 Tax=Pigmentiphaga aceris TaxID=1940612 RepID=A0A5C0B459_9BURK|nr:GSCFA domain-containing protein [Pigmentiphaga aceris]
MHNPYRALPARQFWTPSVAMPARGMVDPVSRSRRILPHERIVSFGSCFAQHISQHLVARGLNYHMTESAPPGMDAALATARQYGLFSARYGNVYTPAQAEQLFDRAFGHFAPNDDPYWEKDGRWYDAFRPTVEPGGFADVATLLTDQKRHLTAVRALFEQADFFVFTLGLTEAWRNRRDGAVYPVAPGVVAGSFDSARHEFVNFSIDEVRASLFALIEKTRALNPRACFILTVSPVPLIATYEARSVLSATAYSKAVLRVAADEAERRYDEVYYFPAYEIVTSPAAGDRYWAPDLRSVRPEGVAHVMRAFDRHFVDAPAALPATRRPADVGCDDAATRPVCDEEVIVASLKRHED